MSVSPQARVRIYPPDKHGIGSFGGGRITEIKPIGFSQDGSEVKRIGPLFYWAWASAKETATIAMHPHKGFEIVSYVLSGELAHRDTGGNSSNVSAGGVQMMQTGSGISHEEKVFGSTELLQIWFEPDLREWLRRVPTYREAVHEDLPATSEDGVTVKFVVGGESPLGLVSDARLEHWTFGADTSRILDTEPGTSQAILVVAGELSLDQGGESHAIQSQDFVVADASADGDLRNERKLVASGTAEIVIVTVPTRVSYELLRK